MSLLFEPYRIGPLEVKNRFVHSATYECMAGTDGEVTDELVNRYRNLAKGEVASLSQATYTCSPEARPLEDKPEYTMTDWCPD